MDRKKIVASFELTLMMVSLFAFSYGVAMTDGVFDDLDKQYEEARAQKIEAIKNIEPQKSAIGSVLGILFDKLKSPLIPVVSAEEVDNSNWLDEFAGGILIESEVRTSYPISSQAFDAGCCLISKDGQKCGTAAPSACVDDSPFAEGALCAQTAFCAEGCCYNEVAGIYDRNTMELDCPATWVADPNCNMPAAQLGCCVLDGISFFETQGQCEVRVNSFAQGGDQVVDWRRDLNEGQCVILSATQVEGACVLGGGECSFGTEADCYSYSGEFSEGFLCTSPLINSNCNITEQTTCVEGKDGVYFLDSCGNTANIYDAARKDDPVYWDLVAAPEDLCGDSDFAGGGANSPDCGNCNRFLGGICASAAEDGFSVDVGRFYCKDTSCMFDGESYENGESWCVYDGAIGNGDDVVGSRHWKYVCAQGSVQVEPCADYRNQICAQVNTLEINGTDVEFRNANCIANNWRQCVDLNSEEDGLEQCEDALNCRVEKVDIADKFKFDVCLPKYPGGFSLKDPRYMETAKQLCLLGSQNCTVVYAPKTWGGCEIVANGDCLKEGFAQGMNDLCRGFGDCGGAVNVEGEYSENYKVEKSPVLSQEFINGLKKLANPVPEQFAELEDYSEYLEAAGLWGNPGEAPEGEMAEDIVDFNMIGMGIAGIGYAAGVIITGSFALAGLPGLSSAGVSVGVFKPGAMPLGTFLAPFASAAMGAGIGMIAGTMLAKALGLSPAGTMMMAVGGAMIGIVVSLWITGAMNFWNPVGWTLIGIAIVIMIISLFFGGDDCAPVEVTFECKPWKPPVGGDNCEKCNEDPLKPCSQYRCDSLGAACELVNKGTEQELCHSSKDDGRPPILNPQTGIFAGDETYSNVGADGFSIVSATGGCIDAYTPVTIGIVTDELAYCKFDTEVKEFAEMDYDLGGNAYLYNHTTTFSLPDPSHGQSQGSNWTGELDLFVKCQDSHGHETPKFYTIGLCVKEGDDVTGPMIRATEPVNDGIVSFDTLSENVTIVTNELASCKWDVNDTTYSAMANSMECNDNLAQPSTPMGYVCTDVLPTANPSNDYYIRCMDQPWLNDTDERNANVESFVYTLRKPASKISIEKIAPNVDFEINTAMTTIELKVETANGGDYHWCSYSFSGYERMVQMFETGEDRVHVQSLNRPAGKNKIYVECKDETGDSAQSSTEFEIIRDSSTPQIARAWQTGGKIYIITTETAECRYSTKTCGFAWDKGELAGNGNQHTIDATKGELYYIKCEDDFGNAPSGCSITLTAL